LKYYFWSEDICIINNLIYNSTTKDGFTKEDKERLAEIFSSIYGDLYASPNKEVILEDKENEKNDTL